MSRPRSSLLFEVKIETHQRRPPEKIDEILRLMRLACGRAVFSVVRRQAFLILKLDVMKLENSLLQSADIGAGFVATTAGRVFSTENSPTGVSSHRRTAGSALRMATSPAWIRSSARLKSS